jgi:hypothetical protein
MLATTEQTVDDRSNHLTEPAVGEEWVESFLRTPLLDGGGVHQDEDFSPARLQRRATGVSSTSRDIRQQQQLHQEEQQQCPPHTASSSHGRVRRRILDRSGNFGQSRGRWGVDRQTTRRSDAATRPWLCCCQRIHREWGKDWFFWLAYQKTCLLFLLLFLAYGLIIVFFGFIYLVSWERKMLMKSHINKSIFLSDSTVFSFC